MTTLQQTISPVDGRVYVERRTASADEIDAALKKARGAQAEWKRVPVAERAAICRRFAEQMLAKRDELGAEITWQMGRPICYTPREIDRMAERAFYMIEI